MRLVLEHRNEYDLEWAGMRSIAAKLGIGSADTLRNWVRQAEVDGGRRAGVTADERQRLRDLEQENSELRRANEISSPQRPSSRGSSALDRTVVAYIDAYRELFGLEPIRRTLQE
jgi:transposase-like protein